jgi:hypothetical protein
MQSSLSLSKLTQRSVLVVCFFLAFKVLLDWENVLFSSNSALKPEVLLDPVSSRPVLLEPSLSPWSTKPSDVLWTGGDELLQQEQRRQSRRGIVLLRATNVPIPKPYQKAYGEKGKPHDTLIFQLIKSIRKHSSSLPIVAVTNQVPGQELLSVIDGYLLMEYHVSNTTQPWREKIPALLLTPFEETLYLDTDMEVCHDVEPLFDVLQSSEMGLVRTVPQALEKTWNKPAFIHDFYGCFLLYQKTERVHMLFSKAQMYNLPDQLAINHGLNVAGPTKPNIYTFPAAASAICRPDLILPIHGPVYTIHGVRAQCGRINAQEGSRYLRCWGHDFQVLNYTQVQNRGQTVRTDNPHVSTNSTTVLRGGGQ